MDCELLAQFKKHTYHLTIVENFECQMKSLRQLPLISNNGQYVLPNKHGPRL